MTTTQELLPVHSAVLQIGGRDIEVLNDEIRFDKNGCGWTVVAVGPGATYPYILFKDGHRILSFTQIESLTNFFKGIHYEKAEAETAETEKA